MIYRGIAIVLYPAAYAVGWAYQVLAWCSRRQDART